MNLRLLSILLFFTLCLCSLFETGHSQSLVLQDVHVLTMEENQLLNHQAIIIENGEIVWMGDEADADIPPDARLVTGRYYVMPGLAEMHAHIPQPGGGEQAMKDVLVLYLSQGITTIRGMLGHPAHLELKEQAANGEIDSPRIFTSGPSFNGNSVSDAESARRMVREQAEAGYDLLKLHPGLTVEQFDAIADEAYRQGIEFSGHISHDVGLERSLNAGQGTIDHLDRYMEFLAGNPEDREDPSIIYFGYDLAHVVDESRIEEAARLTAEAGVWNVPTHTLLHNVFNPELTIEMMRNWPGMEYIPDRTLENWSNYVRNIRESDDYNSEKARLFLEIRDKLLLALHAEGAGILLGADAPQIFNPPGFSAHRELKLLTDAGLSPFEALKTGTVRVADYLNEDRKTGKVVEDARADLILLNTNPLQSIPFQDQIEGVIAGGKYYDRAQLDQMLSEIESRVKSR